MPISLATLREGISRILGDFLKCSTTTNITNNNYIISAELEPYTADNYFDSNWCVIITSGNNAGAERVVKGYTAASCRLEVYGATLLAETGAVTFELHRFAPSEIANCINAARLELYPALSTPQVAPNEHFEDWASASYPDYWRVSGITAAKEASNVHQAGAGAKLTRAGTDGYLYISTELGTSILPEDAYYALLDLRGQEATFSKWVKASAASQARLSIYCGSDARTAYSKFHSGGGAWELLEARFGIPWDASEVTFRIHVVAADGSLYVDGAGSAGAPPLAGAMYLSSVSADADEAELAAEQARGLEYYAAALVLDRMTLPPASEEVGRYASIADRCRANAKELLRGHRVRLRPIRMDYGWLKDLASTG